VTVKVFGSKLNDEPHETYEHGGVTVLEWLERENENFKVQEVPPISVSVNGRLVPSKAWGDTPFSLEDEVHVVLEPKGTELFFGALFLVAIRTMAPKIPKTSSQTNNGDQLNSSSVKGNKVKINSVIREVAGRRRVYPDYLLPARRYFTAPRTQWVDLCLCIGKGYFDIPSNRVLIGDTPVISLGSEATYTIYEPGADLSADPAAKWWHDVTEVGSSSNGSAGLQLTTAVSLTPSYSASSQIFDGYTVTIPSGAGTFPSDWSSGLIVRMLVPYTYDFIDGAAGARDIIRGSALSMLAPVVGQQIEIAGSNAGTYVVNSYTPAAGSNPPEITLNFANGSPVTGLTPGTLPASIGPAGMRYRITVFSTSQITVERLTSSGASDASFPGFTRLQTAQAAVSLDASSLVGGYRGPFVLCPRGQLATVIEWDVFFPSGLIAIGNKDGYQYTASSTHVFEYRDADVAGAWTPITVTHSAATLDSVGFTNQTTLPYPMRPEGRIRRLGQSNPEARDDAVWYGVRSLLNGPTRYEGCTVMTLRVRNGDRLSAQSESLVSAEVTRKLPVLVNGTWSSNLVPTQDIAPWYGYQCKAVGYQDSDLDLAELSRLDAVWKSRGDQFNQVYDEATTVNQVLTDTLAAGFAENTVERGKLRPVRDEPMAFFENTYSPQNMTEELERDFEAVRPGDYDGVDVEYVSSTSWQVETVKCRLPGDLGKRAQKITAEGVTNRTQAWRIGMRQRRALKYRRWSYSFSTELDALNSRYLSYDQLVDNVPGYAQSAIMIDYDPATLVIESSEAFDWSAPGDHFLTVRREDGSTDGPFLVQKIDEFRLRLLGSDGLDFVPVLDLSIEPPHLIFGIGYATQITDISPNGVEGARIEARQYDGRVYLDDENSPP
jgi:Sulfur transfer protein involved in thiamine biosynthesis